MEIRQDDRIFIGVAGPQSVGKTTFCHILQSELRKFSIIQSALDIPLNKIRINGKFFLQTIKNTPYAIYEFTDDLMKGGLSLNEVKKTHHVYIVYLRGSQDLCFYRHASRKDLDKFKFDLRHFPSIFRKGQRRKEHLLKNANWIIETRQLNPHKVFSNFKRSDLFHELKKQQIIY